MKRKHCKYTKFNHDLDNDKVLKKAISLNKKHLNQIMDLYGVDMRGEFEICIGLMGDDFAKNKLTMASIFTYYDKVTNTFTPKDFKTSLKLKK